MAVAGQKADERKPNNNTGGYYLTHCRANPWLIKHPGDLRSSQWKSNYLITAGGDVVERYRGDQREAGLG